MEILLLIGLGAYLLSQQTASATNGGGNGGGGNGGGAGGGGGGQSPTQGTQVEISNLRLPSIIVGGRVQPLMQLPYPANVVYSNYLCKQPGGGFRAVDIMDKLQAYTVAYDLAIAGRAFEGVVRYGSNKGRLRQAVRNTERAYQSALQFHFIQCSNYAKQL